MTKLQDIIFRLNPYQGAEAHKGGYSIDARSFITDEVMDPEYGKIIHDEGSLRVYFQYNLGYIGSPNPTKTFSLETNLSRNHTEVKFDDEETYTYFVLEFIKSFDLDLKTNKILSVKEYFTVKVDYALPDLRFKFDESEPLYSPDIPGFTGGTGGVGGIGEVTYIISKTIPANGEITYVIGAEKDGKRFDYEGNYDRIPSQVVKHLDSTAMNFFRIAVIPEAESALEQLLEFEQKLHRESPEMQKINPDLVVGKHAAAARRA